MSLCFSIPIAEPLPPQYIVRIASEQCVLCITVWSKMIQVVLTV